MNTRNRNEAQDLSADIDPDWNPSSAEAPPECSAPVTSRSAGPVPYPPRGEPANKPPSRPEPHKYAPPSERTEQAERDAVKEPGVMRRNYWQPTLATFSEAPPKRAWLFRHAVDSEGARVAPGAGAGVIGRGFVQNLAGHGGSGKGIALVQFALATITGRAWLGLDRDPECSKGKVLLVVAEDDREEYARRLWAAGQCLTHAERELVTAMLGIVALQGEAGIRLATGFEPAIASAAHADLWDLLRREAHPEHGWAAVVLDPYSHFAGPNAESDNGAATENMALIDRFTKAPGSPGVIVAHHVSLASNGSKTPTTRGVGAADNSARAALGWQREGHKRAKLTFGKNNYAPKIVEHLDLALGADGWWAPIGDSERQAEQAAKVESEAAAKVEQIAQRTTIQAEGKGAAFEALVTKAMAELVAAVEANPRLTTAGDVKAEVHGGNTAGGPKDTAWKRLGPKHSAVILKNSEGHFYVARHRADPS